MKNILLFMIVLLLNSFSIYASDMNKIDNDGSLYKNCFILYPGFEFQMNKSGDKYNFSTFPSIAYSRAINEKIGLEFGISGVKNIFSSPRSVDRDFHFYGFGYAITYFLNGFDKSSWLISLGNGYNYENNRINSSSLSLMIGLRTIILKHQFWDFGFSGGVELYRNKKSSYRDSNNKIDGGLSLGVGCFF